MSKFENLSLDEKMALQREFETSTTTPERRITILQLVRQGSNESKMGRPCPMCKNYPFFAPHDEALIEGHVYSHDGVAEIRITGYCEFCFDKITAEPEEDDEAWKQEAIAQDIAFMAESMGPGTEVRRLSGQEVREMFNKEDN